MRRQQIVFVLLTAASILPIASVATAQTPPPTGCPQFSYPELTATVRPRLTQTLTGHTNLINSLNFSCDGQTLISTSSTADRSVRLWNWRSGEHQLSFTSEQPEVGFFSAFLSPDRQTLITADTNGAIQLRNPQTGAVQSIFPARTRSVGIVALTQDGQTLVEATGLNGDFGITLWNFNTQQQRTPIQGAWVNLWTITPDGYTLAAASESGTASIWNVRSGQRLIRLPTSSTVEAVAIALTPNGESLVVAHRDGSVKQWSTRTGRLTRTLFRGISPLSIAVSSDGRTLAVGYYNHIRLWNLSTNRLLYNLPANALGRQTIDFSPDGRFFVNTDEDGSIIRVWQLAP